MSAKRCLYGATIFWSALLLFVVQPMMAKAVLPWFGGAAGVWTACMLFFQGVLLAGYLYADWLARRFSARGQVAVHVSLLVLSLLILPVKPAIAWKPNIIPNPIAGILILLAGSVGPPYFLLSTTGPLVQSWYARAQVAFPYRLFVVSNIASLAALLAYPVAIEPFFSTRGQLSAWSAGYAVFVLLAAGAAFASRSSDVLPRATSGQARPVDRIWWVALAACASVLWLAVANHLSQNIAPIPFLWVLPLGLYLLSFVVCFDRRFRYHPRIFRWLLPVAWVGMVAGFLQPASSAGLKWSLLLFSGGLLVCCLFCHGELAGRKPEAGQLTSFYVMVALGGAIGGVFVGLIAPTCFNSFLELPLGMAACVLTALTLLYAASPRHLAALGVIALAAFVLSLQANGRASGNRKQLRSFYGVLRVSDTGSPGAEVRVLSNGSIQHGIQFLDPGRSLQPSTYYAPESGAAVAIRRREGLPQRVGVIGLGAGTLALYGCEGDLYRFYELNPQVIQLAQTEFTFLRTSMAHVEVIAGDARLALEREPAQGFDVLIVDAFTGDAIPVHLLTREAFALYFHHMKRDGILAVHITNRFLNLAPVVRTLADELHARAILVHHRADPSRYVYESTWVLVSASGHALDGFGWVGLPVPARLNLRVWTDDYSNLFQVLR